MPYAIQTAIDAVTQKMQSLDLTADKYDLMLQGYLERMASIQMADVAQPEVIPPTPAPESTLELQDAPDYENPDFEAVEPPQAMNIDSLLAGLDVNDLGDFPSAPVMPVLSIPSPPAMANIPAPPKPNIPTDVPLPTAPSISMPELGALVNINIPAFEFPSLPDFSDKAPEIDFVAPDVFINWAEPVYQSEILSELKEQVLLMMKGGTGLPAPIEDALFSRARERDSAETERSVQEAVDTWASRGFSMPPGMLTKQANAVREQGRLKAAELNRDILVQAATWEIENLRFAVTQGMALEQLIENLFENATKRTFEVARFQAESQINAFNARIGLFNAQNAAFQTLAQVYRAKLDGALGKLQAYKTAVEAQSAIGQINQQQVEVYKSKVQAVQASVEIFNSQMRGAQVQSDVIKGRFDAYRAEVQAYSEQIGAEKVKLEAHDSIVKGEVAKAGLFEVQARNYAATIQAIASKADVKVKGTQLKIEAARVYLQRYLADTELCKLKLDTNLKKAQFGLQAFQSKVEGWKAGSQVKISESEVQSRFADMQTRTNIAYSEMQMHQYQANIKKASQQAQIALEAAKAMGQYAAQLAAGAMSAMHVSASVSGSGSQSDSWNTSNSTSTSTSHNYSY